MTDSPLPSLPIPTAKKVKSDSEPSEVVPDVFLGSIGAAHNREVLQRLNITHVLTVAGGFEPKFPSEFTYECVDVKDVPEERLCVHFDRCLKFIAKCLLDGGRVLVHCFAGKSRSATICAAYVMATEGWTSGAGSQGHRRRETRRGAQPRVHDPAGELRAGAGEG